MRRSKIILVAVATSIIMLLCLYRLTIAPSDPRLASWHLVSVTSPSTGPLGRPIPTRANTPPLFTLKFSPAGVQGQVECNSFRGNYRLDTTTRKLDITIGAVTLAGCMSLSYIHEQEYLDLLGAADRYECNPRELRVYIASKQTVLIFENDSFSLDTLTRQITGWIRALFRLS